MQMELVLFKGQPFAYVQSYEVHAWPQPHLAHLPIGSRALDTFIGEPAMIGRGHGSAYLRIMALRLQAEGAPVIAIDPSEANRRAVRAYYNAGFHRQHRFHKTDSAVRYINADTSRICWRP